MNQPRNLAASVRQRLLNLAQTQKEDFNLVLIRYGIERLLYRLERSAAGERFILKGAMLFVLWSDMPHRTTKDVDLLSRAIAATFNRRRTPIPMDTPLALTSEFADDETKQRQSVAFVKKGKLTGEGLVLNQIGAILHDFLMPPTIAIRQSRRYANGAGIRFDCMWSSDLGWR